MNKDIRSYKLKNEPKNYHYQSQFLIRKFAIDPNRSKKNQEVFVLHKWTKNIEKKKISEICSVEYFNTYIQEKKLWKMERDIFAPSLRNCLGGTHDELDIKNLKCFASILLCGTPKFRKNLITNITEHIDNESGLPTGSVNIMNDVKGKFDWTENCAKAVFREIEEWEYLLIVIDRPLFITSNSPVVVNNRENGHFKINITSLKKSENIEERVEQDVIISFGLKFNIANVDLQTDPWIHFPISPNHLLIFASTKDRISKIRSDFDSIKSDFDSIKKENLIREINTFTFAYSEEYAISSKRELLEMVKPLIKFE